MSRLFLFITLGLNFFTGISIYCQPMVTRVPLQWGQYVQNFVIINPASIGVEGKLEINLGNQRHLGLWRNTQQYYGNVNYEFGKSKRSKHVVGVLLTGEKEGQYLDRTRIYALYAFHMQLRKRIKLSVGAALGTMTYNVSGNDFTSGGASTAPDGNIGLWFYDHDYYVGISHNQFFDSKVAPLTETTVLVRHWNITGGKNIAISPYLELRPSVLVRYVPSRKADIDLYFASVINEQFLIGANYRHLKEMVFMVGMETIKFGDSRVKAFVSYNVPVGINAGPLQTIEFTLKYLFNNQLPNYEDTNKEINQNDTE